MQLIHGQKGLPHARSQHQASGVGCEGGGLGGGRCTRLGSCRSLAVWKEADLLQLPPDSLPLEHAAVMW